MASKEEKQSLKERLICAGIEEIAAHGIADFSLRRVAAACQVSCAAPYRHFADRDEFIRETVGYINRQWGLLQDNISRLYEKDSHRRLIELCVAYIRFLVANDNYRNVLVASGEHWDEDERISLLLRECFAAGGVSEEEQKRRAYAIRAMLYGTVAMLTGKELPNEEATFAMIRLTLQRELDA